MAETIRVCVAVPTFRRPEPLARVLAGIGLLAVPRGALVEALVADNDAARTAETVVATLARNFPFPLAYTVVGRRGLAQVRNAILEYALARYDFLAMLDDDESPTPGWLGELLRMQTATCADAVFGPVPSVLAPGAPEWLRRGRFLEPPRYPDGALLEDGYSGNCLLRLALVRRLGVRFDARLDRAGGEDLLFFRTLRRAGAAFRYAAGAAAPEIVEDSRGTVRYVLAMNFRRGSHLALCDRVLTPTPRSLALRALKGAARIAEGCLAFLPGLVREGRAGAVQAMCSVARGLGTLAGLVGYHPRHYGGSERAA
ncbi:MAG: glycosyltransferase [Vulcanimicrobiaceae bacterium]